MPLSPWAQMAPPVAMPNQQMGPPVAPSAPVFGGAAAMGAYAPPPAPMPFQPPPAMPHQIAAPAPVHGAPPLSPVGGAVAPPPVFGMGGLMGGGLAPPPLVPPPPPLPVAPAAPGPSMVAPPAIVGPPPGLASSPGVLSGPAPGTTGKSGVLVGFLVTFQNEPTGIFWPIHSGRTVIGRAGSDKVDIGINDASSSARHACVHADPSTGQAYVEDESSRNGTFLNERKLPPGEQRQLHANDRLRLGSTTLVVKLLVS